MWSNELFYPVYATAFSVLVLLLQLVVRSRKHGSFRTEPHELSRSEALSLGGRFQKHLDSMGGHIIFTYRLARLIANGALLGLHAFTVLTGRYRGSESEPNALHLQIGLLVVYVSTGALVRLDHCSPSIFSFISSSWLCYPYSLAP